MSSIWQTQILAFFGYFLYASFFEWMFHRHLFHSAQWVKATYRAHHLVHHQRYKYEKHLYEHQDHHAKEHITMDWFALPMFIGFHLPIFAFVQSVTGVPSLWGGLAAVTAYYAIYEYFHYYMHVPAGSWFEKTWLFNYVKEHHRIHHRHTQKNFNVFFPLADLCLGTYVSPAMVEVWKREGRSSFVKEPETSEAIPSPKSALETTA